MKAPAPGDVQLVRIYRRNRSAAIADPASTGTGRALTWEPLAVAPPPGLYDAVTKATGAPFRPIWVDVELHHAMPEPTAYGRRLDINNQQALSVQLDRHLMLGVLQLVTTAILRERQVQPETPASDNPGLS